MGENENRHLKRRTFTPQFLRMLITVPSHHHRAHALKLRPQNIVGRELVSVRNIVSKPPMQDLTTDTHRFSLRGARPRIETVQRNTQTRDHTHEYSLLCRQFSWFMNRDHQCCPK